MSGEKDLLSRRLCAVRPPDNTNNPSALSNNDREVERRNYTVFCIPQRRDGLANLPISLGIKTSVDRDLYNWNISEFLPKHDAEWKENAMIKSWSFKTSTIRSTRLVYCGGSCFDTCLDKTSCLIQRSCWNRKMMITCLYKSTTLLAIAVSPFDLNLSLYSSSGKP